MLWHFIKIRSLLFYFTNDYARKGSVLKLCPAILLPTTPQPVSFRDRLPRHGYTAVYRSVPAPRRFRQAIVRIVHTIAPSAAIAMSFCESQVSPWIPL